MQPHTIAWHKEFPRNPNGKIDRVAIEVAIVQAMRETAGPMSKPTGPIPPYFAADERGMLCVGGRPVDALIEQAGDTPLFVYDMGIIAQRVASLRSAMPEALAIHYAIKANSYAPLLQRMVGLVDGFDVASGGELAMASKRAWSLKVSFAGPGKRDSSWKRQYKRAQRSISDPKMKRAAPLRLASG